MTTITTGKHGSEKSRRIWGVIRLGLGLGSLVLANTSYSQIIAYEGFNYSGSPALVGLTGGTGFSGAWSGQGGGSGIGINSLSFLGLQTSANNLTIAASGTTMDATYSLASSVTTGTVWLSFLMRASSAYGTGDLVGVYALGNNAGNEIFVGVGNNGTAFGVGSGSLVTNFDFTATSPVPHIGNPSTFIVLKLDRIDATNTTATFYINPTPGLGAPDTSSIGSFTYATGDLVSLGVYSNSAVAGTVIDELRLGGDFSSVAPIPEPATYGIAAGLVALGLTALKRRRCVLLCQKN